MKALALPVGTNEAGAVPRRILVTGLCVTTISPDGERDTSAACAMKDTPCASASHNAARTTG